ncbi:MAG: DUF4907 domain-containing protein [Crocinitomicaceae bacterium]|jgi:hypothetical protein|nr:DUF4907 domain-containing protein [Crocinitomicaceae bacterium]
MRFAYIGFLFFLLISCENSTDQVKSTIVNETDPETPPSATTEEKIEVENVRKSPYEVKTIQNSLGWGYEVWKDGALVINQTHIPAIQGLRAFTSQEQAQKAVDIIKTKLDKGVFPPTISIDELRSIGVDTK